MKLLAEIYSYWTFDTDLAAAMAGWNEYVSGAGYSVDLRSDDTDETVTIRLAEPDGDKGKWLEISATSAGQLFERALGRAAMEMAKNSEIHVRAVDVEA